MTVVVPTLAAGPALFDCIFSLDQQTRRDFEVIIVDNSGKQLVQSSAAARFASAVLENERNTGFGAAVNAAFRRSRAPFLATLNDDAVAHPEWLARLMEVMESRPDVGMCASQVRLAGQDRLDSAGMLICRDGSSKQRGHFRPPSDFDREEEALLPSASAALYRRAMLEEIGLFDEDFFLYCEDTDLGLRARWAGWKCVYVPGAVVEHYYSHTAGLASPLKAYYVERNRMFVAVKNFPAGMLWRAPWHTLVRYAWHAVSMAQNRGLAGRFRESGHSPLQTLFIVFRAHCALLFYLRGLWKKRRKIQAGARISSREFRRLLDVHSITPRQVAAL